MNLRIKQLREIRGFSQKEIADLIDVPYRRYGSWERGERNMNLEDAVLIADVLNCSLDELVGRDFSPPTSEIEQLRQSMTPKAQDQLMTYAHGLAARFPQGGEVPTMTA